MVDDFRLYFLRLHDHETISLSHDQTRHMTIAMEDGYWGLSINHPTKWKTNITPTEHISKKIPGDIFNKKYGRDLAVDRVIEAKKGIIDWYCGRIEIPPNTSVSDAFDMILSVLTSNPNRIVARIARAHSLIRGTFNYLNSDSEYTDHLIAWLEAMQWRGHDLDKIVDALTIEAQQNIHVHATGQEHPDPEMLNLVSTCVIKNWFEQ